MDEFINNQPQEEAENIQNENTFEEAAATEIPVAEEPAENKAENTAANEVSADETSNRSTDEESADYSSDNFTQNSYIPPFEAVKYTPVKPVSDYKPMSKGLKVFAALMALIILLTASGLLGYFAGKNKTPKSVDLSAKPKSTEQMTEAEVYEKTAKSIVGIVVYNASGNGAQASGIVYNDKGYIVTNDHIYSETPNAKFKIYTNDGKEYSAKFVAGDKVSDLAVLKMESEKLSPAEFGNSDELYLGENVVAIGRPNDAKDKTSITSGIVSALNRRVSNSSSYSSKLIQTDAAINPGSSGGALVNMYGQVVGITSSKLAAVDYEGIGYAIPTTTVKRIVDELISKGKVVSRAKLGISYNLVDSVSAELQNHPYTGLYVASVTNDSDLYGKVEKGDMIIEINGKEIDDDDVVLDLIEQSSAGDKITVKVYKADDKTVSYTAVLKPNYSESSYSTEEATNNSSGDGKTFDFPFGD